MLSIHTSFERIRMIGGHGEKRVAYNDRNWRGEVGIVSVNHRIKSRMKSSKTLAVGSTELRNAMPCAVLQPCTSVRNNHCEIKLL